MYVNQSIINIDFDPIQHKRTKYIEIGQYFIRQNVEDKKIKLIYVQIDEWIADIFMKGLTKQQF